MTFFGLGVEQADGLDVPLQAFLAQIEHGLRRVGDRKQRRVALLTPTSVACADSSTATSSSKACRTRVRWSARELDSMA
jgi:hypothetical protein